MAKIQLQDARHHNRITFFTTIITEAHNHENIYVLYTIHATSFTVKKIGKQIPAARLQRLAAGIYRLPPRLYRPGRRIQCSTNFTGALPTDYHKSLYGIKITHMANKSDIVFHHILILFYFCKQINNLHNNLQCFILRICYAPSWCVRQLQQLSHAEAKPAIQK